MKKLLFIGVVFSFLGVACSNIPATIEPQSDTVPDLLVNQSKEMVQTYTTYNEFAVAMGCSVQNSYRCLSALAPKDLGYEPFVMMHLNNEANEKDGYIKRAEAVDVAKKSEEIQMMQELMPNLFSFASIYTSREILPLEKEAHWFIPTDESDLVLKENEDKEVWSVLITCKSIDCPATWQKAMALVAPEFAANAREWVFLIDAKTGELILRQPGSGMRGDAIYFVQDWSQVQ